MEITIRKGEPKDVAATLELIKELALFEKAPEQVITNVQQMMEDGFGQNPFYKLMVAEYLSPNPSPQERGIVVGVAVYFNKYSTWKGKGLYLDDIVIKESFRGKKIGSQLFEAVVEEAKSTGCKQMHWQVLDWNEPAINFYKKYNAEMDGGWINCKLHF